jgi:uncharacterized protein YdeI (YjbR/CyaY-like superfamily)
VTAQQWDQWLAAHHASAPGALVAISRKGGGAPELSYAQALDVALTWGWIDGQKRSLDDRAWLQRFTPRRPKSPWSKINCSKAEALVRAGKMHPAGLREIDRAKQDGRWDAAYDSSRTSETPDDLARALAGNKAAAAFFAGLDAGNRYAILYRLQTAKKPETRAARLAKFVEMLARKQTLHPARPGKARARGPTASGSSQRRPPRRRRPSPRPRTRRASR